MTRQPDIFEPDDLSVSVLSRNIRIRHLGTLFRVLKAFGHLISIISFKQLSDYDADIYVINLIAEYSSNTVKELSLDIRKPYDHIFDNMLKPFKKLEILRLRGYYRTLDSPIHTFSKLFPMIQQLDLSESNILDGNGLDHKLKHLERLSLNFKECLEFSRAKENFKKLLIRNPNIRRLSLSYCEHDFVKFISENLRQLQFFTLTDGSTEQMEIVNDLYFDSVKVFHISRFDSDELLQVSPPTEMFFTNAVEIHVDSFKKSPELWTNFMARSSNLKNLKIEHDGLNDVTLKRLNLIVANLTFFHTKLANDVKDETMLEFIQRHPQLLKVHWTRDNYKFSSAVEVMRRELGDQWLIAENLVSGYYYLAEITLMRVY